MTDVTNFTTAEFTLALLVAVLAQAGGLLLLKSGGGTALHADISDERARPMSVAITPMVDDAPLLKLGSPKQPGKLPDRWIAPRPVERTAAAAFPSPHAQATPQAIPTAAVADAGQKAPSPDAEVVKSADLLLTVPDAGPLPVSTIEGAADGKAPKPTPSRPTSSVDTKPSSMRGSARNSTFAARSHSMR